jgi:glycosyltransferase involved in cell wall biosynthesis
MNANYIIVTPVKNEEECLPYLAESILNQSIKPKLWFIINDGSADKTTQIIEEYKKKYDFIHSHNIKKKGEYLGKHISIIMKKGFQDAIKKCEDTELRYEFIANIDADMILHKNYFEKTIAEFRKDKKLGIIGGTIYYDRTRSKKFNNKLIMIKTKKNYAIGGLRTWRKDCFKESGGIPISFTRWDSISNIKAELKNWKVKSFDYIKAIHLRETSTRLGYWNGFKMEGKGAYYVGNKPFFIILKCLKLNIKFPFYQGLAFGYGYFNSYLKKEEKTKDREILRYYLNKKITDNF